MNTTLLNGDCLELLKTIPDGSVDMVLCDLPYGTTACKWDTVIPFEPLWAEYRRVTKPSAAVVLTASQPFTSLLVASNLEEFRYCWVWEKNRGSGWLDSKSKPLKFHEDIAVFYGSQPTYNPQKVPGKPSNSTGVKSGVKGHGKKELYRGAFGTVASDVSGMKYPKSVLKVDGIPPAGIEVRCHPTQKPVALMEYLIRTYTNEGDTVLDNCMGSGTTGVACLNTRRNFIGMEMDEKYFNAASDRIYSHRPTE